MSAAASPKSAGVEPTASVQRVDPARQLGWDEVIANQPHGSFFHSAAWAKVLADAYGYTPTYFTVNEGGVLRSVLPLMEVDSWLTGRRGVSLPFTDDCEPIYSDDQAFKSAFGEAKELGRARQWKYI